MREQYKLFRKQCQCLGRNNMMSYEQFCYMASQELFKPYIETLTSKEATK